MSCRREKDTAEREARSISFGEISAVNPREILNTSFIKLETTDSCLINSIETVASIGNFLVVLDARSSELYVFDKEGHYLNTIGRRGNGPGEYVAVSNFFIDASKGKIGLIDVDQEKVIYYSMPDFHFLAETKLSFQMSCCEVLQNGNMVCNNRDYDKDGMGNYYFILADSLHKPLLPIIIWLSLTL